MVIHPDFLNLLEELSVADSLRKTGHYAPTAASLDADGVVSGGLSTGPEPFGDVSIEPALEALLTDSREGLAAGRFVATIIIFHGYQDEGGVHVAHRPDEATCYVAWLHHANGDAVQAVVPYEGEPVFSTYLRRDRGP